MKKYALSIIFLLSILYQHTLCDYVPSLNYKYLNNTNNMLISFDMKSATLLAQYGVYDELTLLKLAAGARIDNGESSLIYNLGLVSYQSLFRIPIIRDMQYDTNDFGQEYYLRNDYSTFLTFSYQGLSFDNSGFYEKDYNWSSLGIDLLYKKFDLTHFYTKLSFTVSANTIKNSGVFFNDSTNQEDFCFNSKLSSFSKFYFKDYSNLRFEVYWRNIYNYINQKEIYINLGYEYMFDNGIIINPQIGYTIYGTKCKWKDFSSFCISLSYRIR